MRNKMSWDGKYNPVQSYGDTHPLGEHTLPPVTERIQTQSIDVTAGFDSYTPQRATYQANDLCNLSCKGCFLGKWLRPKDAAIGSRKRTFVTQQDFKAHLSALGPSLEEFFLLGAEPTVRPEDSNQMLAHAHAQGLSVMAVTNAAVPPAVMDRTFLFEGADKMHKLNISIDSMVPEVHNALRGKQGALEKTLVNLKRYLNKGFPIKVQITVWPENYPTFEHTLNVLFHEFGVRRFAVHYGSLEGVPNAERSFVRAVDPEAWRVLCEVMYTFIREHQTELEGFNFPFVYFTPAEMAAFVIGDPDTYARYLAHVERVEQGIFEPMPIVTCPASDVPQLYVYGLDGPEQEGELSICQIHSGAHPGMHFARFDRATAKWCVNQEPNTSQLHAIQQSPYYCLA